MNNKYLVGIIIFLAIALLFSYSNKNSHIATETKFSNDLTDVKLTSASQALAIYEKMSSTLPQHDMYCIPKKKSSCGVDGCKDVEAKVFVLLGKSSKPDGLFLARCDNKPCDVYDVNLRQSGAFTSFETIEPLGMLFKMSTQDSSYVEIVTLGTDTLISNGVCYGK